MNPERFRVNRFENTKHRRDVEEVRNSGMLPTPWLACPIYGREGFGFS